jgi:hypothetical protein
MAGATEADLLKRATMRLEPVLNREGVVAFYDVYVCTAGGCLRWIGSHRTKEQCEVSFKAFHDSVPRTIKAN